MVKARCADKTDLGVGEKRREGEERGGGRREFFKLALGKVFLSSRLCQSILILSQSREDVMSCSCVLPRIYQFTIFSPWGRFFEKRKR